MVPLMGTMNMILASEPLLDGSENGALTSSEEIITRLLAYMWRLKWSSNGYDCLLFAWWTCRGQTEHNEYSIISPIWREM